MARHQVKKTKTKLFIALLGLSLFLLFTPQRITSSLNFFFVQLFKPALSIGKELPYRLIKPGSINYETVSRREYNRLWAAYKNLEADLDRLARDYETLAGYKAFFPNEEILVTTAGIITYQQDEYLSIDKGTSHGIRKGQYILGQNTIIGVIGETSSTTARVILVTDTKSNIPVIISREGKSKKITGNLKGTGLGSCKIDLVSTSQDVKPGDTVLAEAIPGKLPASRVIGEVVRAWPSESSPLLWDITVLPIYRASDLNNVAVITPEKE
ncbi:rod shape-determining protein MreC [Limihaloglobus sulfuriphilus]|uniref:Cell shape-determining protein MreC n=1 Tax=Limihaloglobus sulfuriphilus TaxID=1851148 RepID=A0A1Q2MG72_9BACT|nr:rod shape-determining protein MreC [Limihaloglobus sulfuriphilus]AQQ71272.1 rod shape-determining protein MreC [Limihaloglobus sulfuriphilus]